MQPTPDQQALISRRAGALIARCRNILEQVMKRRMTVKQFIDTSRREFGAFEVYCQDVLEGVDPKAYSKLQSDADGDWTNRSRGQLDAVERKSGDQPGEASSGAGAFGDVW